MNIVNFKKRVKFLLKIPLHSRWLICNKHKVPPDFLRSLVAGILLDIGCGHGEVRRNISTDVKYTGLDYLSTASTLYKSTADLYADANYLPIALDRIDNILLLNVLEHLENLDMCLDEISCVLKKNGKLFVEILFLYPIYDKPYDYHRWTTWIS